MLTGIANITLSLTHIQDNNSQTPYLHAYSVRKSNTIIMNETEYRKRSRGASTDSLFSETYQPEDNSTLSALPSQEAICELYQRLVESDNPDLSTDFEKVVSSVLLDFRDLHQERDKLELSYQREQEKYDVHLRQLERDLEDELQRMEQRVRTEEKQRFDLAREELRSHFDSEMGELQRNLAVLEKQEERQKETIAAVVTDESDRKEQLEGVMTDNRKLRSELTDAKTSLALLRSDMVQQKQEYDQKSRELGYQKSAVYDYIKEQDNLTRQLHMLHDANRRLQDANDDLRSALETGTVKRAADMPPLQPARPAGIKTSWGAVKSQPRVSTPNSPLAPPSLDASLVHSNNVSLAEELQMFTSLRQQSADELGSIGERTRRAHSVTETREIDQSFQDISVSTNKAYVSSVRKSVAGTSRRTSDADGDSGHSTLRELHEVYESELDLPGMVGVPMPAPSFASIASPSVLSSTINTAHSVTHNTSAHPMAAHTPGHLVTNSQIGSHSGATMMTQSGGATMVANSSGQLVAYSGSPLVTQSGNTMVTNSAGQIATSSADRSFAHGPEQTATHDSGPVVMNNNGQLVPPPRHKKKERRVLGIDSDTEIPETENEREPTKFVRNGSIRRKSSRKLGRKGSQRRAVPTVPKPPSPAGEPERMFKIVLAGDAAVGKSSFILRLCKDKFVPNITSTLGIDFQTKIIEVDGRCIALQLWDTAGQERFRSIATSYFRRADGVLLLYDCSYERSFLNVREWMTSIEDATRKKLPIMLVGNKVDIREAAFKTGTGITAASKRFVTVDEGQNLAREFDGLFIETSAKDGNNVSESVVELARLLRTTEDFEVKNAGMQLQVEDGKKNKCCL